MATLKRIVAPTLLDDKNHALLLVDPQPRKLLGLGSQYKADIVGGISLIAKGAKMFGINRLITTTFIARDGLLQEVDAAFPDEPPVDRTALNPFEDERIVYWAEEAGKSKLVVAGLWTESSVAMGVLSALSAGYEVYLVTDASGGATREAHEMAVRRMLQTGAIPISSIGYLAELQRDWARVRTAEEVIALYQQHGGRYGDQFRRDP
jgi:nicotinamidase-related amidase